MQTFNFIKICYGRLLMHCPFCDSHSVPMYKHSKFLVEILELTVSCLCHSFHRRTLSQHNPLGHLLFLLHSPQGIQKFHLHLPNSQIKVQTTWIHTYRYCRLLSYTCLLDPKKIFFTTVIVKNETSICVFSFATLNMNLHEILM